MEHIADWKSVVDPGTGKTYWYHRKTRESRWTKPQFIEEMEDVPVEVDIAKSSRKPLSASHSNRSLQSAPKGLVVERDIYRFYGSDAKADQSGLNSLFGSIDLGSFVISTSNIESRSLALRCLWKLSVFRHISSRAFTQNTSWTTLASYVAHWNSPILKLWALAFFSSTIIGDTSDIISDDDYALLCGEIKNLYLNFDNFNSQDHQQLNSAVDEIISSSLFFSSEQGKKGHVLPSYLLLFLSKCKLSLPGIVHRTTASNIAATLQRLYVAHQVFEESEIAIYAKDLLLQCMVRSVDVLEGVLEGYLAMSTDFSQTAKSLGPTPSTYAYLKDSVPEAELEEAVHGGAFEIKTYHDLPDDVGEKFLRDVEWIPKSGVGWQLNSILLWLRCPALRELVNDFWQQGGGSHTVDAAGSVLELSIDASDEVVEAICHYVHYGGLILTSSLTLQLETLKVASELGMLALQDQMEAFLCQEIRTETLDALYLAAKENGYPHLEENCVRFMNGELHTHSQQQQRHAESLQQTLATTFRSHKSTSSGQLRTKDLHDFDEVGDDVLQDTLVDDKQRKDAFANEFGGYATASNPSVDYMTMNEEADNFIHSYKLAKKVQEYRDDSSNNDVRPNSSHAPLSSTAVGNPSRPKSGGIYSLLLEGNEEDAADEEGLYVRNQVNLAATTTKKQKDVVLDKKPTSAGGSRDANGTTSTRKSLSGTKGNVPSLQEFDPSTMSLVPKKEKTEAEKRLEELSKPRSHRRSTAGDLDVDTSFNSNGDDEGRPPSTHPSSVRSSTAAGGKGDGFSKTTGSSQPSSSSSSRPAGTATTKKPNSASSTTPRPVGSATQQSAGRSSHQPPPSSSLKKTASSQRHDFEEYDHQDDHLLDDLYLDYDGEQTNNSNHRHAATFSAPAASTRTGGGRGGGGDGGNNGSVNGRPPMLLSSTSNPRLRSSTEPVLPGVHKDQQEEEEGGGGVGGRGMGDVNGGTQIRSSLALLKAKVSKTAGRSRRISAGATIGNFAATASSAIDGGVDSESSAATSPVPGSSSAAVGGSRHPAQQSAAPLRQSSTGMSKDRYATKYGQSTAGGFGEDYDDEEEEDDGFNRKSKGNQQRTNKKNNNDYDDEDYYADDFEDHGNQFSGNNKNNHDYGSGHRRTQQQQFNQRGYDNEDEYNNDDDGYNDGNDAYGKEQQQQTQQDPYEDNGAAEASVNTEECPDCGRHFVAESFARHVKICKKVFLAKRKVFDSSKQRLDANPETLAAGKKKNGKLALSSTAGSSSAKGNNGNGNAGGVSKWKEQSRQFREAMKAARNVPGSDADVVAVGGGNKKAPAQPYIDPTLIQCPNCQRRFNDKAAERHIPICNKIIAKPSALKKGGGQTAGTLTATQTRNNPNSQNTGGWRG